MCECLSIFTITTDYGAPFVASKVLQTPETFFSSFSCTTIVDLLSATVVCLPGIAGAQYARLHLLSQTFFDTPAGLRNSL